MRYQSLTQIMTARSAQECGVANPRISMVRLPGTRLTVLNSHKVPVTFDAKSQGQLAMVVYEWGDMAYLGKVTSTVNTELPVSTCPLSHHGP